MAKNKRIIPATEWLSLSPLEREYYKPKKMSKWEEEELLEASDFISQVTYQKELVNKARLKWALTHTSWENKYKFIEEYGDEDYKGSFKGHLKNAAVNYFKRNKRGEIDSVGWYINAAYDSDVDYEVLKKLDALAQVLTHDELQQLYKELPNIREYYVSKGSAHADEQAQEWSMILDDLMDTYIDMIKKNDKETGKSRGKKIDTMLEESEEWI